MREKSVFEFPKKYEFLRRKKGRNFEKKNSLIVPSYHGCLRVEFEFDSFDSQMKSKDKFRPRASSSSLRINQVFLLLLTLIILDKLLVAEAVEKHFELSVLLWLDVLACTLSQSLSNLCGIFPLFPCPLLIFNK